jgi:hypothetical protein
MDGLALPIHVIAAAQQREQNYAGFRAFFGRSE